MGEDGGDEKGGCDGKGGGGTKIDTGDEIDWFSFSFSSLFFSDEFDEFDCVEFASSLLGRINGIVKKTGRGMKVGVDVWM